MKIKLSDKAVNAFSANAALGKKLADGGDGYLLITPARSATTRVKYRIDSKEKTVTICPHPTVTLCGARFELGEVKALLLEGRDPVTDRCVSRAAYSASADQTFQVVAQEWLSMKQKWSALGNVLRKAEMARRSPSVRMTHLHSALTESILKPLKARVPRRHSAAGY